MDGEDHGLDGLDGLGHWGGAQDVLCHYWSPPFWPSLRERRNRCAGHGLGRLDPPA